MLDAVAPNLQPIAFPAGGVGTDKADKVAKWGSSIALEQVVGPIEAGLAQAPPETVANQAAVNGNDFGHSG
jgi:hypothetical protein